MSSIRKILDVLKSKIAKVKDSPPMANETLLSNVHNNLSSPLKDSQEALVKGSYLYYHYRCDGFDDRGWGCGYRTLQTLCSWIIEQERSKNRIVHPVPSIKEIQEALVKMGDKPKDFIGSRNWIGSFEVCLCIDYFYSVSCKIIHMRSGSELSDHIISLKQHFEDFGSPAMMGGDTDASSKGILGICGTEANAQLLILDPHLNSRAKSNESIQQQGWIQWHPLSFFLTSSFYNICLPQYKAL